MRKISSFLVITFLLLAFFVPVSFADYQIKSDDIRVDSSLFSGVLSPLDNTAQKIFEKIDDFDLGGGISTDSLSFIIDGNGAVISAGASGSKPVPYNCTITGWEIVSNTSGSAVVDIKKSTYASWDTFASIAGTEKPTLTIAKKNTDTSLTTWTTTLTAGDRIQAGVSSSDINGVVIVTLYLTKS